MIVAGVDYSMSCPALVIGELGSDFSDLKFYSFAKQKRHISIKNEIILLEYPEYINEQDRYDKISDIFINLILSHNVDEVLMEGYAYGSNAGLVFQIAENTEVFKYKLFKNKIPFSVIPPAQIKKLFTGRGNANKGVMYTTFRDKHCPYCIFNAIGVPKVPNDIGNPVSDIIDAYAIWLISDKINRDELTES